MRTSSGEPPRRAGSHETCAHLDDLLEDEYGARQPREALGQSGVPVRRHVVLEGAREGARVLQLAGVVRQRVQHRCCLLRLQARQRSQGTPATPAGGTSIPAQRHQSQSTYWNLAYGAHRAVLQESKGGAHRPTVKGSRNAPKSMIAARSTIMAAFSNRPSSGPCSPAARTHAALSPALLESGSVQHPCNIAVAASTVVCATLTLQCMIKKEVTAHTQQGVKVDLTEVIGHGLDDADRHRYRRGSNCWQRHWGCGCCCCCSSPQSMVRRLLLSTCSRWGCPALSLPQILGCLLYACVTIRYAHGGCSIQQIHMMLSQLTISAGALQGQDVYQQLPDHCWWQRAQHAPEAHGCDDFDQRYHWSLGPPHHPLMSLRLDVNIATFSGSSTRL